jgi:predicted DNA-binding transcriptional regulator AlpA
LLFAFEEKVVEENPEIQAEWVSYRSAQTITGLSRVTLWKMAKEGLIPVSKQGRAVRLHRKSIDELMWRGTQDVVAGTELGEDKPSPEER